MNDEDLCYDIFKACEKFLDTAKVDKGHGIDHITAVLSHVNSALNVMTEEINPIQKLAIRIAAILHDVDDHKFFDSSIEGLNEKFLLGMFEQRIQNFIESQQSLFILQTVNNREQIILQKVNNREQIILQKVNNREQIILQKVNNPLPQNYSEFEILVKKMIDLVSCSSNGNSNDNAVPQWMLYPRIADRLEAIGQIGILRALQYGEYRNRPMYDDNTERAYTLDNLRKIACPERFKRYLEGTRSHTTIGHFYDKILHIGKSKDFGVDNTYFETVAEQRHQEVENWILNFWHQNQ